MSSTNHGNRARSRAIRAEMSASGESYSRAAPTSTPTRPGRNLRAVCFDFSEDIPPRGGVIHVVQAEVCQFEQELAASHERRVARAVAEGRPRNIEMGIYQGEDFFDRPSRAHWQVHCDACNPHTDPATGMSCEAATGSPSSVAQPGPSWWTGRHTSWRSPE